MLYTIIQEQNKGIEGFLDLCFSFLQRKTDFYYVAEPGDKMGFPPGMTANMVGGIYKKY
jgi:hypothetical protein